MKTKRIKRPVCYLVGLLVFGLMLYSCLQDETDLDSRELSSVSQWSLSVASSLLSP